ncbi:MAG: tail fiber domain-containing protein [Rhodanobacteraceae bacterium]|nr:tail fiber domain-containing protein [Rhodanobacteraceae bacterium]
MKRTALMIAFLLASTAASAAPWTYRGTLNDAGMPANGRYDLRLSLLDASAAKSIGSAITFSDVQVANGNFSIEVDFGFDLTKFAALKLKTEVQQAGSGFVPIGEPTHFDAKATLAGICWDTTGNVVAVGEFLGASNDVGVEIKANNLRAARFKAAGSVAAHGDAPQVTLGSASNIASGVGATVSGGGATRDSVGTPVADRNNVASGSFAVISGGRSNIASGNFAVISGGRSNIASGDDSVVASGFDNAAGGNFSSVSGGENNATSAVHSAIGGGSYNRGSGSHGVVAGGNANYASGNISAVLGGVSNTASGQVATAFGSYNCAGADHSFAAGSSAKIRPGTSSSGEVGQGCSGVAVTDADGDNGTFAWADDTDSDFTSTGPNQFLIRAAGGVAINTATPTANAALTVAGNVSIPTASVNMGSTTRQMINLYEQAPSSFGIGVQIGTLYNRVNSVGSFAWFQGGTHNDAQNNPGTGGTVRMSLDAVGQLRTTTGTIATTSDARLKKNVTEYTGALAQISALRPVHYEYREPGKSFQMPGRHLGFIAQEVEQVFPEWVSQGDDGYLMLSLRGFEAVAVRGMQELSAENEALSKTNSALQSKIERLQAQSKAFEARLLALEGNRR